MKITLVPYWEGMLLRYASGPAISMDVISGVRSIANFFGNVVGTAKASVARQLATTWIYSKQTPDRVD